MASRFILFIVIAKLLSSSDLGLFGLLVSGISFFVLIVGADYYSYSNRELLSSSEDKYAEIISNQIYAYIPLYTISIPFILIIFYQDILPWNYFTLFLILTIVEHIAQEQNRLLNTMQKQLSASIVLFIRTASWVLIIVPLMYLYESFRNIDTLLFFWLIGTALAVILGGFIIKKSIINFKLYQPNYTWILKGYKIGFLFLIGTIGFKALSTLDRFWLEKITDTSTVGVYVFYFSLIVGVTSFIHAGLIVFSAPNIIKSYQEKNFLKFKVLMKQFLKELIIATIILLILIFILVPYIIEWIDKPEYIENYNALYVLMLTAVAMIISNHPHIYLYSSRNDKFILYSHISSLIIFLSSLTFFNYLYNDIEGLYQVSLSILISYIWLLSIKYYGYLYYNKLNNKKHSGEKK
jgi:O-antigen/teichoic acid export membrane protein